MKNPWDMSRVPGGSSGGSAAAVASRMAPAATATDTGGSIRQPAALCGVSGLKPTYGRISRWGMIAFASSLDQAGPIAGSAEDCAILLQAMASYDPRDSTSVERSVPNYRATLNNSVAGVKIGIPKEYFLSGLNPGVEAAVMSSLSTLRDLGAELIDISLPNSHLSVPAYYVIAPAEASANLSRFDGVRYGHRCADPEDLEDMYRRSRAEGFGEEVQRRIMGPTCPSPAFKFGAKGDDPVAMYLEDIYTIATNLAGLPGMSIPCGLVEGNPVGLQLIGNYFDEASILNVAHQLQRVSNWHTQHPEGLD